MRMQREGVRPFRLNSAVRVSMVLLLAIHSVAQALETIIPEGSPADNFYGGVSGGVTKSNSPDSNQDGSVTGVNTDETGGAMKVYGGYEVTPNVSVEGSYNDFGESNFTGTSSGSPSWSAGPVSATHEAESADLAVVGRYPVNSRLTLLGRFGWSWWQSTETFVDTSGTSVQKESGSDFTYGLGFEYDIGLTDRFLWRTEIEQHEVDDTGYELTTVSSGFVYRFP